MTSFWVVFLGGGEVYGMFRIVAGMALCFSKEVCDL